MSSTARYRTAPHCAAYLIGNEVAWLSITMLYSTSMCWSGLGTAE
jgi:hypothetical protein